MNAKLSFYDLCRVASSFSEQGIVALTENPGEITETNLGWIESRVFLLLNIIS